MTSSRMENPLWKLQNDPSLLKFQQQLSNGNTEANNNLIGISELNRNIIGGNQMNELTVDSSGVEMNNLQSLLLNNSSNNTPLMTQLSPDSLNMLKQNQFQSSTSYASLIEHQNQQLQNLQQFINTQKSNCDPQFFSSDSSLNNSETNLNHLLISNPGMNEMSSSNAFKGNSFNGNFSAYELNSINKKQRERGIVEKLVGSYGFVKCLDRDLRLFFHYSSFQIGGNGVEVSLKVGDFVEFEEGIDKRNGKPIAINLNRFDKVNTKTANQSEHQLNIDSSLNLMNLKELLLKNGNSSLNENSLLIQQQQNYQAIMNGLKILNMQNLTNNNNNNETTANNLNSIMNLFNKENIFNNNNTSNNSLNQMNINTNILNMAKTAAAAAGVSLTNGNDNLANLAKMFNVNTTNNSNNTEMKQKNDEQMEGTVAIVATKRPVANLAHYNGNINSNMLSQHLDGRITYQRSGETFYIPYSLSDIVSTTTQLRIGDRVRFYIAHLLNNNNISQQMPVVSTYYARKVELLAQEFMSINDLAQQLVAQQMQQHKPKQVYRGIITTLKDSFGKIEREDLFKETFFHFSEYRGQNPNQELRLGLNVEFELQDRHGKEIACNIRMLSEGSVSFDELSVNVYIGRITQPLSKINNGINLNSLNLGGLSGSIHSIGRLIYDGNASNSNINNGESLVELSFTDRDRIIGSGEYTLLEGDFVQFRIATDKRTKTAALNNSNLSFYQRATQLTLIEEHSLVENSINTNEHRERGVVVKLYNAKDLLPPNHQLALDAGNQLKLMYGAIQCLEQNDLIYFSLSEVINYVRFSTNNLTTTYSVNEIQLQIGDSLEFSVVKCQKDLIFKNGLKAIRLRQLAKNSVQFEIVSTESYNGFIEREASPNTDSSSTGLIRLDYKNGSGAKNSIQTIAFIYSEDQIFNSGDKIKFNISTCLKTKKQIAVNLKLTEAFREQGLISVIKDNYGMIEIINIQQKNNKQQKTFRDICFNSNGLTSLNELSIGDHVEFVVNKKNRQNICAENVAKLSSKKANSTKLYNNLSSTVHKGRITQNFKSNNSNLMSFDEQTQQQIDDDYYGKIQIITSTNDRKDSVGNSNDSSIYQFGLFSLNDKKLSLQIGDLVSFQVGTCFDGTKRAFNMHPLSENQQQPQSRRNNNDLKKGKIESIKGHCGFIEYLASSNDDRKKVFFHISDLTEENANGNGSESSNIRIGDEVEFILMHNSRSGKYSAVKIKKITSNSGNQKSNSDTVSSQTTVISNATNDQEATCKRPERLITKLKLANIDESSGKELVLTRQPNNPDGKIKSFSRQLVERLPGSLEPLPQKITDQVDKQVETSESKLESVVNEPEKTQLQSETSIIDLIMANSPN